MKKTGQQIILSVGLLCIAAGASLGEEIKVGGGGASMSAVFLPVKAHYEEVSGDTLVVSTTTPQDGLVDLVQGRIDLAAGADTLSSMIAGAERDGFPIDPTLLAPREVSRNRTVVLVHPSNRVARLSKEQLKGIFTGKITNWQEVGGDNRDIVVVWGKGTPGQNVQFVSEVLDGAAVAQGALQTTGYLKIRECLAATPAGIGIDPLGVVDATVKVVDAPVLTSAILAITLNKPSAKVERLLTYLRGKGSRYLKR